LDATILKEKFKSLTIWRRGGKRAPHKPLLVLYMLGRLFRNQSRLDLYENIDTEGKRLLLAFGPSSLNIRTEYPFWRLKNDNIWEIEGVEKVNVNKSGDARKSYLPDNSCRAWHVREVFQGDFRSNNNDTFNNRVD
jgi:putative restriction endonuclease